MKGTDNFILTSCHSYKLVFATSGYPAPQFEVALLAFGL